jgi:SAM-dependent methyltransferase
MTITRTGSIPLYRDGRHYDRLNERETADIPFYREEARRAARVEGHIQDQAGRSTRPTGARPTRPVLELACGTGRLTIPIAQAGLEIVGLDASSSMLSHLQIKAAAAGIEIPLLEADCRRFDLGREFALIFMAFNSMQHLHDFASLEALFGKVRRHLVPGGRFVFDVFNPKIAYLNRDSAKRIPEREYEDPEGKGTITVEQTSVYDDAAQVIRIRWYFSRREEKDFRVEELNLRCFYPQELDLLVRSFGFRIEAKHGNFERKPFASGDMKQVVVCST